MAKRKVSSREVIPLDRLTQQQAAQLLGVTARTLRDHPDAPRNADGSYSAPSLVAWWTDRHTPGVDEDPLMSGEQSPALERYRIARAQLAELDFAERSNKLRDVAEVRHVMSIFSNAVRRAGETLQRKYGPDAQQVIDDAIDSAQRSYADWVTEQEAQGA